MEPFYHLSDGEFKRVMRIPMRRDLMEQTHVFVPLRRIEISFPLHRLFAALDLEGDCKLGAISAD